MLSQFRANFSGVLSILLSAVSVTIDAVTTLFTSSAALLTAGFAAYHYFHLAQYNREKKRKLQDDDTTDIGFDD